MTPLSPYYPGNGITPITNANLNTTQPISVAWRTTFLGPRQGEQVNNTQRFVLGLDGNAASWDYNVTALWSNAEVVNTFLNGYPKTQPLRNGVSGTSGAPYLNPFGAQSPQGLAYMQANTVLGEVQNGNATLWQVAGVGSTQFGKLQGGAMTLALGAEFRSEDMVYNTNVPLVSQAASSGLAGSGAVREGDRNIWAVAAEMNFPILKNLDISLAIRYDDYSDFGGTTNPKISARYTPFDILLLRGSYNTGFAAPSLYNLYLPNSTTFTATRYNDPTLCPNGVPNFAMGAVPSRDCGIQFQQLQGGNDALQPEKSDAWTVGFVLQATPEISFGLDYWNYHITDSISVIGEQSIFADPNKYANLYVRCSQASASQQNAIGACQTPGGDPLAYIINTFLNLGDVKTQGIDGQFTWTGGANDWGRLSFGIHGHLCAEVRVPRVQEPNGTWQYPVGIRQRPVRRFGHSLPAGHQLRLAVPGLVGQSVQPLHDRVLRPERRDRAVQPEHGRVLFDLELVRHMDRLQGPDAAGRRTQPPEHGSAVHEPAVALPGTRLRRPIRESARTVPGPWRRSTASSKPGTIPSVHEGGHRKGARVFWRFVRRKNCDFASQQFFRMLDRRDISFRIRRCKSSHLYVTCMTFDTLPALRGG